LRIIPLSYHGGDWRRCRQGLFDMHDKIIGDSRVKLQEKTACRGDDIISTDKDA
jgi:hypothetical protein